MSIFIIFGQFQLGLSPRRRRRHAPCASEFQDDATLPMIRNVAMALDDALDISADGVAVVCFEARFSSDTAHISKFSMQLPRPLRSRRLFLLRLVSSPPLLRDA